MLAHDPVEKKKHENHKRDQVAHVLAAACVYHHVQLAQSAADKALRAVKVAPLRANKGTSAQSAPSNTILREAPGPHVPCRQGRCSGP